MTTVNNDSDTPWKEAASSYFPEFMAFYIPEAARQIDWEKGYTFLDQALAQVVRDADIGKRFLDKFVQVVTHKGDEHWVYIHIEIQGQQDTNFTERMFTYNYRSYDEYRRPITRQAVLADDQKNRKPHTFGYELFGSRHYLEFPTIKLLDYQPQTEALLEGPNLSHWSQPPTCSPSKLKVMTSKGWQPNGDSPNCSMVATGTNNRSSIYSAS